MKNTDLRDIVETSLFAALIFLGVSVFRIPMPFTTQFVHFGNALVVIGCLLFGTKQRSNRRFNRSWAFSTSLTITPMLLG